MYIAYYCKRCGTEFIIPTEHVKRMEEEGRYIACPFGHKDLAKLDKYDSILECMKHDSHTRENRRIKQRGWGG